MKILTEAQYDWAVFPEDLPAKNLVLITAKTPHPTYHKEDQEHPVRLFTTQELHEAARSLAHRPVGLNHQALIAKAFTVDAQYNPTTMNVEALLYFPDEWIGKVRKLLQSGKESIFSVEYTWRDEKETPDGVEFVGLIFDKVDLLCGVNAGDKHTSARLVESAINISFNNGVNRHGYCEAEVAFPSQVQENAISASVANPSLSFFKCKECGVECAEEGKCTNPVCKSNPACTETGLQHAVEANTDGKVSVVRQETLGQAPKQCDTLESTDHSPAEKKDGNGASTSPHYAQEQEGNAQTRLLIDKEPIPKQRPNETNLLNNEPFTPVVNQDPPVVEKPIMNVMSAGFVAGKDQKGPHGVGGEVGAQPEMTMAGKMIPEPSKKMVNKEEHGSIGNADTTHNESDMNQDYNAGMKAGDSLGASVSTSNPIPEVFKTIGIPNTGKEGNPTVDGLNSVDGPDKSNEDTYNQKKRETLTESEKPLEQKPPVEKPADPKPAAPVEPPVDYKTLYESASLRIKELEPVVEKLQNNVKTFDSEKAQIAAKARLEGKQSVIAKVKTVLPNTTLVSGVGVGGAYRALANDLKKVLYESEHL